MQGKRVMVVEDEPDIGELLMLHLTDLHVEAHWCQDGFDAQQRIEQEQWDLVLLDIRLPRLDGLELLRRLRTSGRTVPVLMLTAKTSELDRVLGLELGADDYVTKPFSIAEVMARVKALLRRSAMNQEQSGQPLKMQFGALVVDESRRVASVNDESLDLTAREFDLLLHFSRAPGQVFRRAQLLDQVWGFGHEGYEHTVNSHINRLRNKFTRCGCDEDYIITVWGVGYKFNDALPAARVA